VGGMEAAAGMVVDGTAAVGMEDGMAAAGTEDGGVAGAVGVVAGTEAGGMEEVGGPDMATAGMVLVILIGAGTVAVGGRVGAADTGAADGGVVSTEAGTAVTGVSRSRVFFRAACFQRWLASTDPGSSILKSARHRRRQEIRFSGLDPYIWISLSGFSPRRKSYALRLGQLFGKY